MYTTGREVNVGKCELLPTVIVFRTQLRGISDKPDIGIPVTGNRRCGAPSSRHVPRHNRVFQYHCNCTRRVLGQGRGACMGRSWGHL